MKIKSILVGLLTMAYAGLAFAGASNTVDVKDLSVVNQSGSALQADAGSYHHHGHHHHHHHHGHHHGHHHHHFWGASSQAASFHHGHHHHHHHHHHFGAKVANN